MGPQKNYIYTIIILFGSIAIFGMRRSLQLIDRHGTKFISRSGIRRSSGSLFKRKEVSNVVSQKAFHRPIRQQIKYRKPSTINTLFKKSYKSSLRKATKQSPFWQTSLGKHFSTIGRTIRKSKLAKWLRVGGSGTATILGASGASAFKLVTDKDLLKVSTQKPEHIIAEMQKENTAKTYIPFLINNAKELVKTPKGTRVLQAGLLIFAGEMKIEQIEGAILPHLKQLNNAQNPEEAEQVTFFFNQLLNKKPKLIEAVSEQTIANLEQIVTGHTSMPIVHVLLKKDQTFAPQFMQAIADNPSHAFVTNIHLLAQDVLEDRFDILYKIGKNKPQYYKALLAALSQEKSGAQVRLFETKSGGLLLQNILESTPKAPGWFTKSIAHNFNQKTVQQTISKMFNNIDQQLQTAHKDNLPLINKLLQDKSITTFRILEQVGAELPNILYANPAAEQFLQNLVINNNTVRERLLKQMQGKVMGQNLFGKSKITITPPLKAFIKNITDPKLSQYKKQLLLAIQDKPIAVPLTVKTFKKSNKLQQPKVQLPLSKALKRKSIDPKRSGKSYLHEIKMPDIFRPKLPSMKFIQ